LLRSSDTLRKKALEIATKNIGKAIPADEVAVGRVINQGIKDGVNASNGFVGRFNARSNVLFGEVDKYLKPDSKINLGNTVDELRNIISPVKGAEKTSVVFQNQFLDDLLKGLESDLAKGGGKLPYEAIKGIKGKIGKKLSSFDLITDVDKGQIKTNICCFK
jgi:hypothetical protein